MEAQLGMRDEGRGMREDLGLGVYACPSCQGDLTPVAAGLRCAGRQVRPPAAAGPCQLTYPLVDGIPDFILGDSAQSPNILLRHVGRMDRLARVYESRWWYPLALTVYSGWRKTSLRELVRLVGEMVRTDGRLILDVACGPGTLGRRIVSPAQEVYGVDISLGMLQFGQSYARRDRLSNVHFARAQVEALPFRPATFDAAICGGALHLFPDTVAALRQIARTMQPGAPLAVTTFVAGDGGVLQFRRVREHIHAEHRMRIFELPELQGYLAEAGFTGFAPQVFGSFVVFRAVRAPTA